MKLLIAYAAAILIALTLFAGTVRAADGDTIGGRLEYVGTWVRVTDLGTLTADVVVTSASGIVITPDHATLATGESFEATLSRPLACGESVSASFSAGPYVNAVTLTINQPACPSKPRPPRPPRRPIPFPPIWRHR